MMIAASLPAAVRHARRAVLTLLTSAVLSGVCLATGARAQEPSKSAAPMEARVRALIPDLETYIQRGMKAYDLPGLAIGIVTGDRLVYAKGFGVRSKAGGAPVDARIAFQIGSLTKGFLATTMAIMVDRGKVHWNDRVVDLYPAFQFQDAWVTREFRVFDLMAQRSGLRPSVNNVVGLLGYAEQAMIRSLRYVEPVSSFRTSFAYTNMTHVLAGRIVADLAGAPDWNAIAQRELLDPLGMAETTFTAEAMKAAANRAQGHRWTPDGTIEVPFEPLFPYGFGAAGDINSTLEDMAPLAPSAARKRDLRGAAHRVAGQSRLYASPESRGRRHRLLRDGLVRGTDAQRQHRLARRRHEQLGRFPRHAAGPRCRGDRAHQRG
jgi:CubicO group peptidase (beta-lactamase class C family)